MTNVNFCSTFGDSGKRYRWVIFRMDKYCADNSGFGPVQQRAAENARPGGNAFHLQSFVTPNQNCGGLRAKTHDTPSPSVTHEQTGTAIPLAYRWLSDREGMAPCAI
jgi:hypothetical protein